MDYGKVITSQSYFDGKCTSTKICYRTTHKVSDKSELFSEIMKALEIITSNKTDELILTVTADPKTHKLKMLYKEYEIE